MPNDYSQHHPDKRSYTSKNYNNYYSLLKDTNWDNIITPAILEDPNLAYTTFSTKLRAIVDTAFPIVTKDISKPNSKTNKPCMTQSLIKCSRKNQDYRENFPVIHH